MNGTDLMKGDVADLALRLETMTDDEVFLAMNALEKTSETSSGDDQDEVLSRIALIEAEIESRFPGQLLAPYREWKNDQLLL